MRTPPALMRGLAVAAVVGQGGIAVTGAAVRVTGSGLGCPTWPQCFPGSMVPVAHAEVAVLHQWIEFGNRLLGVALVLVTGACVIAAHVVRPRRRRLLLLAWTMPLGVVAQAVIGGITVLTGLAWYTVAPHFIVSVPLVWLAVLLARDAWALPDERGASAATGDERGASAATGDERGASAATGDIGGRREPVVPREVRGLLGASAAVLFALVVVGTLVTSAGPHAGDPATPRLTAFSVADLAMAHAHLLFAFLGLLVGLGFLLHAVAAPRSVLVRFRVLVVVTLAQGVLGGIQYAIGVPEVLVALHVLGSMLVVAATAWLWAGTTRPAVADPSSGTSPRARVAAQA